MEETRHKKREKVGKLEENGEKSFFLFYIEAHCECHFKSLVLSVRESCIFLLHLAAWHGSRNTDASTRPKIICFL